MENLYYITLSDPTIPAKPRHLAYYRGQSSNPPILCLHGLSRNAHDFDVLAQRLSAQYYLICVDMAGRGKSDWLSDSLGYNYSTYFTDTLALLDSLHIPQATFIGTSMGGIISMMIAAQQPQRVQRLILNDIGSVVSAKGLKRILSYVGSATTFANAQEAMQQMRTIMAPFGITAEAHWQKMLEVSFVTLPDGTLTFAYDPEISTPLKTATPPADIDLSALWRACHALPCPGFCMVWNPIF